MYEQSSLYSHTGRILVITMLPPSVSCMIHVWGFSGGAPGAAAVLLTYVLIPFVSISC